MIVDEEAGLEKQELLRETEQRVSAVEDGPVVHTEPLKIPARLLSELSAQGAAPSGADTGWLMEVCVPTLIIAVFAVLWSYCAYLRHDVRAYGVGMALMLVIAVSVWQIGIPKAGHGG